MHILGSTERVAGAVVPVSVGKGHYPVEAAMGTPAEAAMSASEEAERRTHAVLGVADLAETVTGSHTEAVGPAAGRATEHTPADHAAKAEHSHLAEMGELQKKRMSGESSGSRAAVDTDGVAAGVELPSLPAGVVPLPGEVARSPVGHPHTPRGPDLSRHVALGIDVGPGFSPSFRQTHSSPRQISRSSIAVLRLY